MKDRFDIHQHITDQVVAAIERGAGDFRLPWHRAAGSIMRPVNVASKKAYRGINILALWATADEKGFSSGVWGTYKQWTDAGAQVCKGEKAAFVVFYKELAFAADPESGDAETATRLLARSTPVFAAEQVDGFTPPTLEAPPATVIAAIEQAEAFVAATGASIHHGGGRAFYRPSTDSIQLPPREAFIGTSTSTPAESYYSTLLHELTHWTSHESRCNRQLGKRFGDQAYAMEELVAELGAAFLCADLDIADEPRADHAQYLASWLSVLKADKKAIFTAASKASEAAAFLAGLRSGRLPPPCSASAPAHVPEHRHSAVSSEA
jgi:antirestriction protein ArdC